MHRETKKWRTGWAGLLLLGCAAIAALLYLAGGVKEYRAVPGAEGEIAANRALLAALEQREPPDLNAEVNRLRAEKRVAQQGILVDDIEAEQQKILAMTDWDMAQIARWYKDAAIVGDSIVRQLRLFHMLDEPVFAEGGIHLSINLELLDQVEAARPSVIFLCFGMNDVGIFQERVDRYVERYSNVIRRLQANLPDALIYVHAALPVTEACIQEDSDYQYIGLYNEEMKKACPGLGVYFIDSRFLLDARPEYYSSDGRHPNREYYPLWLTYLADLTGLSDEHAEQ